MDIHVLIVPYSLASPRIEVGRGPEVILAAGVQAALARSGHATSVATVELPEAASNEIGGSFAVARLLAEHVATAQRRGAFPLVLAGNCYSSLGTTAGLGAANLGVVWFDAHADFNTPETTITGFFDGTPLATLTGAGWANLRQTIPGFLSIPERRVVLLGVRDTDPLETDRLRQSAVTVVPPDTLQRSGVETALAKPLETLRNEATGIYLHIDLDALDPSVGRANVLAVPGGLTTEEIAASIRHVGRQIPIRGAAFTAYDPSFDPEGAVARVAAQLISVVAETAAASSP